MNKTTFTGNLGNAPEMRYTPNGQAVTNFSVASTRKWTGSDGQKNEETTWFRVATWGKLAEVCNQYLEKGRKVLITGRLNIDPATGGPRVFTRNDGSSGAAFEITAEEVEFLSGGSRSNGEAPVSEVTEEDIPF